MVAREIGHEGDALVERIRNQSAEAARALSATGEASLAGVADATARAQGQIERVLSDLRMVTGSFEKAVATAGEELGGVEGEIGRQAASFGDVVGRAVEGATRSAAAMAEETGRLDAVASTSLKEFTAVANRIEAQNRVLGDAAQEIEGTHRQLEATLESGRVALMDAARRLESSNRAVEQSLEDRRSSIDELASTLLFKTESIEALMRSFAGQVGEAIAAAEAKARATAEAITQSVTGATTALNGATETVARSIEELTETATRSLAESAENATRSLGSGLEGMQETADREGERAREAIRLAQITIVEETTRAISEITERYSELALQLERGATEMRQELEATRAEIRRGLFELPEEARESTEAMRRAVSGQLQALEMLSGIVSRQSAALAVAGPAGGGRPVAPVAGDADVIDEPRPARPPVRETARIAPIVAEPAPPRPILTPPAHEDEEDDDRPTGGRGWITDLLRRASDPPFEDDGADTAPTAADDDGSPALPRFDGLSGDIARAIDEESYEDLWARHERGEAGVFTRRLYTMRGQQTFDEIRRKYARNEEFRAVVDQYVDDFDRLLDAFEGSPDGAARRRGYLGSETGKVYTLLAHASGRFG